jgi:undecaprenyl-phosphate 4-deoxy-4-formamido-L-arabinose transferase
MHDASDAKSPAADVALSVVVPVFQDEATLTGLFDRLYPVLDGLRRTYEVVLVDDGSRDRSPTLLRQQHRLRPEATRVLYLRRHLGREAAIQAGLAACVGQRVLTLAPDVQAPPEAIPRLLAELDRGHDTVGCVRRRRDEPRWRGLVLRLSDGLRERLTGLRMGDPGCLLRAYERELVDAVLACGGPRTSVQALACQLAGDPTEVLVDDDAAEGGPHRYRLYERIRLNFDLVVGSTLVPLQVLSLLAMGGAVLSLAIALFLALRLLVLGTEAGGLAGLFGALFLLFGIALFGLGLLGGYLGRLLEQGPGWTQGPPLDRLARLVREELAPRPRTARSGTARSGTARSGTARSGTGVPKG